MRRFTPFRWVAVLTLALALVPSTASSQEVDTLSIRGTFQADTLYYPGIIGDDLAEVLVNGDEHGWTLTLHGVSYSYDYRYGEWNDEWGYGYSESYATRVHATSFDFAFVGPDADILNEVVSRRLVGGSLPDGALLEVWNGDYFDSGFLEDNGSYSSFVVGLRPLDVPGGISFYVTGVWNYNALFSADDFGFPIVQPQRLLAFSSIIADYRPGNSGGLGSHYDIVDIGSAVPAPPTLNIADGSVREGNKGTTWLNLTVTLSCFADDAVTVDYTTVDRTALVKSDYTATSGTLTFQPGQTGHTISVSIKGDRKREPNEAFSVQLSNAVGATIDDGFATATILNDD